MATTLIDPTNVRIGIFPLVSIAPQDVGLHHTYWLYVTQKVRFDLGVNPTLSDYTQLINKYADTLESMGLMPQGGLNVITEIIDAINANQNATTFGPLLDALKQIHLNVLQNVEFSKSLLPAFSSVAYYSAAYWSEILIQQGAMSIPNWLKTLAGDVGGALGGAASGAEIGTLVPGIGNVAGAIGGAIVGGVCASLAV